MVGGRSGRASGSPGSAFTLRRGRDARHAVLSALPLKRPDPIPIARRGFAEMTTNPPESAHPAPGRLAFADCTLDLRREVLRRGGEELRLRPRTFQVLRHLLTNAGRVVTKQELLDVVWADAAVTEDSLVQCLIEIRRALPSAQDAIKTIRGRGYLVDCEVRRIDVESDGLVSDGARPVPSVSAVAGHDDPGAAPTLAKPGTQRPTPASARVWMLALVLTLAGAGWLWIARGTPARSSSE